MRQENCSHEVQPLAITNGRVATSIALLRETYIRRGRDQIDTDRKKHRHRQTHRQIHTDRYTQTQTADTRQAHIQT